MDPEIQSCIEDGDISPIPAMRNSLEKLLTKLDGVAHDFDKAAERAGKCRTNLLQLLMSSTIDGTHTETMYVHASE